MELEILLPFPSAETMTESWAFSEAQIDFRHDPEAGARCTISYAAVELRTHLLQMEPDAQICFVSQRHNGKAVIELHADSLTASGDAYALLPQKDGLLIRGAGRVGVLYGVYEFLKMQGWRWLEPGTAGEYAPEPGCGLLWPKNAVHDASASTLGRGFSIEGALKESADLLIWMARNRMNAYGDRPNTRALMRKLGIVMRDGGHIFEAILAPDRPTPSSRTLWDAHPEWYGTPAHGPKSRQTALQTQFCVSQPELIPYLCEELLRHIMGPWHEADEIDVWGLDTWGSVCTCERCRALGNGTDQMLHMASHFRSFLDRARAAGRLDHDVKMALIAYEGTSTLAPPERPIPQNLLDAGDYLIYAPIVRCYAHGFDDPGCSYNRAYASALSGWNQIRPHLPVMVLEYYNVSKFEDLPLLFTHSMAHDFQVYRRTGAAGFVYMHVPLVNWGMRALTQVLFAELAWDPDADIAKIKAEFLSRRYGAYAGRLRSVYDQIDMASQQITSWRAWKDRSLLSRLQSWNGGRPERPLQVDDHFQTPEAFDTAGEQTLSLLQAALLTLRETLSAVKHDTAAIRTDIVTAANPAQQRSAQQSAQLRHALEEDLRLLVYGTDTMQLMLRMGQYYTALYAGRDDRAALLWRQIDTLEQRLEQYYMPLTFSTDCLDLISNDALTRTQLREVIARCRKFRIDQHWEDAVC